MKQPLITFLASMAAAAVIVAAYQDWWGGIFAQIAFVTIVGLIIFIAHLWGIDEGIKHARKNNDILFNEGFQTGKRWRG